MPAPEPLPAPEPEPAPEPLPAPETPGEDQYDPGTGATPAPAPTTPVPTPAPVPETPSEDQYGTAPLPEPGPPPAPEPPGQYDPGTGAAPPVPETPGEEQYDPGMGGAVPPGGTPPEGPPAEALVPVEAPAPAPAAPVSDLGTEPVAFERPEDGAAYPSRPEESSEPGSAPALAEDEPLLAWASLETVVTQIKETLVGALAPLVDWSVPEPVAAEYWGPVAATLADLLFGGQPSGDDGAPNGGLGSPATTTSPPDSWGSEGTLRSFPAGSPPTGAPQALSSGGGTSAAGGGAPPLLLLLCVLVSAALLAQWDGKLSWMLSLLPRPRSVPRAALERPG